jgi:hypothetical protein
MTVGIDFDPHEVPNIHIGSSSLEDVRKLLGDPWRVGLQNSMQTWTYGEYKYYLFNPAETRDLVIRFQNGLVKSFTFNSTNHDDIRRQ